MKGNAKRGDQLSFGSFGLKATEGCWVTARQIEAARVAVTRFMKREGQIWIRIFPDKPITSKPAEVRMGKGKGSPQEWVAVIKPGRILFEIGGVDKATADAALRLAKYKLPVRTKIVSRAELDAASGTITKAVHTGAPKIVKEEPKAEVAAAVPKAAAPKTAAAPASKDAAPKEAAKPKK